MEPCMKVYGRIISIMAEANFTTLPATCMKVNSSMIWLKVLVFISMRMAPSMWGTGIKISNMASARRSGMMGLNTKDFMSMHQRRDKVNTSGQMATGISESGGITN